MYSDEDPAEAGGCPIRKFTDQSLFAAPHDLSQRTTSFIASQCQGIHQMPLSRLIALIIGAQISDIRCQERSPEPDPVPDATLCSRQNQRQHRIARWKNLYCAFNLSDMARSSTITRGSRASQTNPSFTMSISINAHLCSGETGFSRSLRKTRALQQAGNGGARRDRTDDLKLAKLPLSQLSYGPGVRDQ